MTTFKHQCGCINDLDDASGFTKCILKCQYHKDFLLLENDADPIKYYNKLGCINERGIPQSKGYIEELIRAGVKPDRCHDYEKALEIGCGCSMYAPLFMQLGYDYVGIDSRDYAAEWTRNTYSVRAECCKFEDFNETGFEIVFSAHALEHFDDAPAALEHMRDLMYPMGQLILIVPHGDDDPTNPDHKWFMTETTLSAYLGRIGFKSIWTNTRKISPIERFIYLTAMKA